MRIRTVFLVGTIWLVSIAAAVTWAQGLERGIVRLSDQAEVEVISGENIGFQPVPDPWAPKGKVAGKLVVKVDGEWHEAHLSFSVTK